jgi:hypothetical protein
MVLREIRRRGYGRTVLHETKSGIQRGSMTIFRNRYAYFGPEQCQTEAMRILVHAVATGYWDDLPERLTELRRMMGYAPLPSTPRSTGEK